MVASERCGLSEGRDGVPESHRFPKPGASWSYEFSFPATCAKQARQIWMSIGKGRGTWTRDVFAVDGKMLSASKRRYVLQGIAGWP